MKILLTLIVILTVSSVIAFFLWRKNHDKGAIALALAAVIVAIAARPLELAWDKLSGDSTAQLDIVPTNSSPSGDPISHITSDPSSGVPTVATGLALTGEASSDAGSDSPSDWKVTYPSDYPLANHWGSDIDSSDPTFNSGVAAEGGRQETADIRYVAQASSSEAFIDNNNNRAVRLKAVNAGTGAAGCSTDGGYAARVDVRRHPHVCVRTTEGNFVYFHADAFNLKEVKISDLEIMQRER